ncbi:MAG: DHH family phosphoesterase, partial [Ignavibacterium sp.]|nr:DHH family phosphoesterase [Ignavibacterium sp.]
MIDHYKLLTIINENNSFVLTSHVNPDADAIGSEIALYNLLNKLEKKVRIINHSATPYNLKFLDEKDSIEKFDQNIHSEIILSSDVIFLLDLNNLSRVVSMQSIISKSSSLKVCIDHHQSPEEFADFYFLDTDFAATGEILLDFMKKYFEDFITKEIAIPLYAAIMTDTGSFRFERTTPKLHRDVAYLIEKGVNPFSIYDQIYDQSRFSKIKLLGKSLTTINLLYKNKLAYMIIT